MSKKKKNAKPQEAEVHTPEEMHTVSPTEMTGRIPANPKQAYEENAYDISASDCA